MWEEGEKTERNRDMEGRGDRETEKMIITVEILSYSNKRMFSAAVLRIKQISKVLPPPHHCDTRHDTAFGSVQELSTYTLVFCQEYPGWQILCVSFLSKLILKAHLRVTDYFTCKQIICIMDICILEAEAVVLKESTCVYETSPDGSWAPVEEREREKERQREKSHGHHLPPQTTDIRLEGFVDINLEIVHLGWGYYSLNPEMTCPKAKFIGWHFSLLLKVSISGVQCMSPGIFNAYQYWAYGMFWVFLSHTHTQT